MTPKEQKLIKESFNKGFFRVFDNNADAQKVHELLTKNEVKHEYGDYLHEVDGKRRYNYGIRVLDTRKFQDLINAKPTEPETEEQEAQDEVPTPQEAKQAPVEQEEQEPEPETEQKAAPAQKKNSKKRKKVNLG